MKTPKNWTDNLKNNIITSEMLNAALYSVNKRAKNCRDKKREYRKNAFFDKYGNMEKYESKEIEYYDKKEKLLSALSPICIHVEHLGFNKGTRVYDYENGFDDKLVSSLCQGKICWTNCYIKGNHNREYWKYDYEYEFDTVWFFDKLNFNDEKVNYYLFYELGNRSYHSPIKYDDIEKYDLPMIHITSLYTEGYDINELCSINFVDKVIALIESKDVVYDFSDASEPVKYNNDYLKDIFEQEIRSQNIGNSLEEWKDYLYEKTKEVASKILIDINIEADKADEREKKRKEIEKEYANNLNNRIKGQKVFFQNSLEEIENKITHIPSFNANMSQKTVKKYVKKINKLKNGLKRIGYITYKEYKENDNSMSKQFWNWLFPVDEKGHYKPLFDINDIKDLAKKYNEWRYYENKLTPIEINRIRKNYYEKHIQDLLIDLYDIKKKRDELLKVCESKIETYKI